MLNTRMLLSIATCAVSLPAPSESLRFMVLGTIQIIHRQLVHDTSVISTPSQSIMMNIQNTLTLATMAHIKFRPNRSHNSHTHFPKTGDLDMLKHPFYRQSLQGTLVLIKHACAFTTYCSLLHGPTFSSVSSAINDPSEHMAHADQGQERLFPKDLLRIW